MESNFVPPALRNSILLKYRLSSSIHKRARSRHFELFWHRKKLPVNGRKFKPENNSSLRKKEKHQRDSYKQSRNKNG